MARSSRYYAPRYRRYKHEMRYMPHEAQPVKEYVI
jgi:hypothetical protein